MENNKKENYQSPQVELMEFETKDIITTSGFNGEDDEFGDRGNAANANLFSSGTSYETPAVGQES